MTTIGRRFGTALAVAAVATLLAAACTSGDTSGDDAATTTSEAGGESAPVASGPAPGVTDDSVKIGVTYVDTASLVASGLNYDLGEHEAVYDALFDQINAEGGINGRQLEPVYAPIDPTSPAPAEEACVQLTEDDDVFLITGFFLTDAVSCPVSTHETAVVGGEMTPALLEAAAAPWVTWSPDTDLPESVVAAYGEACSRAPSASSATPATRRSSRRSSCPPWRTPVPRSPRPASWTPLPMTRRR